jgi:hypothetical protein
MQDLVSTILLICAAIAALGLGVVMAYGLCRFGFMALRVHARSMTAETPRVKARIAQV